MFPLVQTKESLASPEEFAPFEGYASRLAALDYSVCLVSEVFVTMQGGNFPHFLMGHRHFMMVTTRTHACESRIQRKMEELRIRYFGYQPLHLPTLIPVSHSYHHMSYEEVLEAGDDHYQMAHFHYLLTSEAERRNGLRLLVEEDVTTEDDVTGSLFSVICALELGNRVSRTERTGGYGTVGANASFRGKKSGTNLIVKERRQSSAECDLENKSSSSDRKLSEKQRERSFSKRHPGKAGDCCSSSKVSSNSEEMSSLGRGDECSVIEETVNSVGTTVEVGEPSIAELMVEKEDRKEKGPEWWILCFLNQVVYGLKIPLTYFQKGVMNLLQCCPAQLNENVYEMMRLSTLLKGARQCLDKRSQEFDALTVKFEVQLPRIKELKDEFLLEKEMRASKAIAVADKFEEEIVEDVAALPEKALDLPLGSIEPVQSTKKILESLLERTEAAPPPE
ncbi:hypothetical protein GIB67_023364 [Kingdonia uniflora]|uniref:O-fucosyltransferase family protein n=1 Tax=Kingdonia uniflora TaxID=39325 RepID=A0A7J7LIG5_9MAGN|nr:hypothetical protein GIB67_023364 [Kingdonia uniflora]